MLIKLFLEITINRKNYIGVINNNAIVVHLLLVY